MNKIFKCLAFSVLFLLFFSIKNILAAELLPAPTILSIDERLVATSSYGTIIKGLTRAETAVDIYVDNIYQGGATINSEGGETDNFYFEVKLGLLEGVHTISAVAWDKDFRNNSGHSLNYLYEVKAPSSPTLIIPNEDSVVSKVKPRIIGLSESATFVHFYIDGVYNGKSKVLHHESGTANFSYIPFLNLKRERHIVWAVAEDLYGRKSEISNILRFNVEEPAVSPTLLSPVVNQHTNFKQPFIVGLVKNEHRVQVYVDNILNGEILPLADVSGTTNFAYKPFLKLKPGKHLIYAVAIDHRGKESLWSNFVYYNIPEPRVTETAAIEEVAVKSVEYSEEKQRVDVDKKDDLVSDVKKIQKEVATSSLREKRNEEKVNLDDILVDNSDATTSTGALNENEEKQNKLQTNIAVFSLFLIAVIAWIFWVNRELIKEKQKEEEENKDK